MSNRITKSDIERLAYRINAAMCSPETPMVETDNGIDWNIGCYHIDYAYGGAALHRIENEDGGVRDVLLAGHMPKPELFDRMHAFLTGIYASNREK